MVMMEAIYSFGVLFITCEIGQRIYLKNDECAEMVDQFDWYLLPPKIQRILPIILNFMQQPFELKCFGSKTCDRELFKSVSVYKIFFYQDRNSDEFKRSQRDFTL